MTKLKGLSALLISGSIFFSSCATICGGSKYNANIVVNEKPNARIFYHGREIGTGKATVLTKRKDANKFSFSVKEDNCEEQVYKFHSRTFRGWAMVGSIVTWTVSVNGVPVLPIGLIIDLSNGSLWKPNVYEKNIRKQNYKNFKYEVDYTKGCAHAASNTELAPMTKDDVIYFKNGNFLRGKIVENIQGKSVQIRVANGTVENYNYDEIEKIEKD